MKYVKIAILFAVIMLLLTYLCLMGGLFNRYPAWKNHKGIGHSWNMQKISIVPFADIPSTIYFFHSLSWMERPCSFTFILISICWGKEYPAKYHKIIHQIIFFPNQMLLHNLLETELPCFFPLAQGQTYYWDKGRIFWTAWGHRHICFAFTENSCRYPMASWSSPLK